MKLPLPLLASLSFALGTAATLETASSYTREEAQAWCQNDALRLCNAEIPDAAKVAACLRANRASLSPDCKKVFSAAPKHHRT